MATPNVFDEISPLLVSTLLIYIFVGVDSVPSHLQVLKPFQVRVLDFLFFIFGDLVGQARMNTVSCCRSYLRHA
ncbi:hypothetical protein BCR41DRAFT_346596 [Lobosporangium transversale]|uniref:Uncharacterized protein n=1 Tax=Lobosporangium transversale TaxID=64571 RepID=A0A1Y2GY99_9FUNG|nr:hypothetical protein BCR41DRAFT_346596 [Lobosporangium transversale]ORZ27280.1 hypothetical protein BCR41DRAFT_346596 [Lobosporangium transversale]|eukprot:XP_021885007.1 hypothetical protein BCR41DRAFT_346596 [Lobosporangium transversale]